MKYYTRHEDPLHPDGFYFMPVKEDIDWKYCDEELPEQSGWYLCKSECQGVTSDYWYEGDQEWKEFMDITQWFKHPEPLPDKAGNKYPLPNNLDEVADMLQSAIDSLKGLSTND